MAEELNQSGTTEEPKPWGDKTPEQIWQDYQTAQAAAESYRTAVGGREVDQVKQGWEWAQQVAQAIQEGKLRYATEEPTHKTIDAATGTQPKVGDEFGLPDNYDELTPREQALLLVQQQNKANQAYIDSLVSKKAEEYGRQLQDYLGRTEQEKGLLFQVLEAGRTNPKLDVKAALEQAAKLKAATPDQLLQMAIERLSTPDPNAGFDEKVAKAVAEKVQELENKRLESQFGISGVRRKVSLKKTPRTREETNRQIMKEWSRAGFSA